MWMVAWMEKCPDLLLKNHQVELTPRKLYPHSVLFTTGNSLDSWRECNIRDGWRECNIRDGWREFGN